MMMMTVLTGRAAILSHLLVIVILVVKEVPSNSKPGCFLKSKCLLSEHQHYCFTEMIKILLPSK